VDINNFISIKTHHPIGAYDANNLRFPLVFDVGKEGETYKGIGRDFINISGLPVFRDMEGAYGSPTSDSERTMIVANTRRIIFVIISFTGKDKLRDIIQEASDFLINFTQAKIRETRILH